MKDNISVPQAFDFDKKIEFLEDIMSWSGGYLPPECEFFKYLEYNVNEDEYDYFESFCNDMADDEVKTLQDLYNNSPKLKTMLQQNSHYTQLIAKLEANGNKIELDSSKAKAAAVLLEEQIKKTFNSQSPSDKDLSDLISSVNNFSREVYDLKDKSRYNTKAK